MANCSNLFKVFNENISVTKTKRTSLMLSKDSNRKAIIKYFKEKDENLSPRFFIQGSYKMKTMIRTKDDTCDLDDGVYFSPKPNYTGTTLQMWVKEALKEQTSTPPEHRSKCVRVVYQKDYDIDHPVYYQDIENGEPRIAIKNQDWRSDDPKAMVNWFLEQKGKSDQLVLNVKYLKAWCDWKRDFMPSGLSMTVLASNAQKHLVYMPNRDDITLRDALKVINDTLKKKFACEMPVTPFDDLFEGMLITKKNNFLSNLQEFLDDANKAILEPNYLKASRLWQKHLGDRFPDGEDKEDEELKSALAGIAPLSSVSSINKQGSLSNNPDGVKIRPHQFYGV